MKWDFSNDRPIYSQIIEKIKGAIASGELKAGERIDSVRELAASACVNPNTMQRALSELEREGFITTQRTSGRFVTEDEGKILSLSSDSARFLVREFIANMTRLGLAKEQIILMIKEEKI